MVFNITEGGEVYKTDLSIVTRISSTSPSKVRKTFTPLAIDYVGQGYMRSAKEEALVQISMSDLGILTPHVYSYSETSIVMEEMDQCLAGNQINWRQIGDLVSYLQLLNDFKLAHTDLKRQNLCEQNNRVYVIDWNSMTPFGSKTSGQYTPGYSAPELFGGGLASSTSDIWSLAQIIKRGLGDNSIFFDNFSKPIKKFVDIEDFHSNKAEYICLERFLKSSLELDPLKRTNDLSSLSEICAIFNDKDLLSICPYSDTVLDDKKTELTVPPVHYISCVNNNT